MKLRTSIFAMVVLLFATNTAFSQAVTGSLLGTISDVSGASAPNAKITITESNTGISRSTTTNESGNYSFPDLAPGTYTVSAEVAGFKRSSRTGVELQINTSPRVDLVLQPGNVSESIEVRADTPLLQTDRSDTNVKIEEKQISNLPISTPGAGIVSPFRFSSRSTYRTSSRAGFFCATAGLRPSCSDWRSTSSGISSLVDSRLPGLTGSRLIFTSICLSPSPSALCPPVSVFSFLLSRVPCRTKFSMICIFFWL